MVTITIRDKTFEENLKKLAEARNQDPGDVLVNITGDAIASEARKLESLNDGTSDQEFLEWLREFTARTSARFSDKDPGGDPTEALYDEFGVPV